MAVRKTAPQRGTRRGRPTAVAPEAKQPALARTGRAAPKSTATPQPPYYLVYRPERWQVLGDRVLPHLSKLKLVPGANGVTADRDGRPDASLAIAQIESSGGQVIPLDACGGYLARDAASGGWYDRWERVVPGSDVVIPGGQGYADWLSQLIDEGIIELPALHVLESLLAQLDRQRSQVAGDPAKTTILAKYEEQIDIVQDEISQALAELELEAEPSDDELELATRPAADED